MNMAGGVICEAGTSQSHFRKCGTCGNYDESKSHPITGHEGHPITGHEGHPITGNEGHPITGHEGHPITGHEGHPITGHKGHPITGHEGPEREWRHGCTIFLTSAPNEGRWSTPRPGRLTLRKNPGAHFTGGRVGTRAGLDGYGECRPHRDSILGLSSP